MAVNAIVKAHLTNKSDVASESAAPMVLPDCGEIIKSVYNILFIFKFLEIHTSLFYIFVKNLFSFKIEHTYIPSLLYTYNHERFTEEHMLLSIMCILLHCYYLCYT